MDNFEYYKENNYDFEELMQHNKQINLPGADAEYLKDGGEALKDKFEQRITNSDYAERTKYYFEDGDLLDAKVDRYRALENDENGAISQFAATHTNKSARKRKKASKKARKAFQEASQLRKDFDKTGKTPMEIYKHREEVMRLQIKAKRQTAIVKSTSKSDMKYRQAKYKLSGLMMLKDQLVHLKMQDETDFESIERDLDKEIAEAEKALQNTAYSSQKKWRDVNGLDDENKKRARLTEGKADNAELNKEDVELLMPLEILGKESSRAEYLTAYNNCAANNVYHMGDGDLSRVITAPCYLVLRDQNGRPVNATEQKKAKWNEEWLGAVGDPAQAAKRKKLIRQAIRRFNRREIPTPEQLHEKGVMYFYKKDPTGFFELVKFCTSLDGLCNADPYAKACIENNPSIKHKLDAFGTIATMFHHELKSHLISQTNNGYEISKDMEKADAVVNRASVEEAEQTYKVFYDKMKGIEDAENRTIEYNKRARKANVVSFAGAKKINPKITKQDYEFAEKLWNTNLELRDVKFVESVKRGTKHLGNQGEATNDISRIKAYFKQVKYNDSGEPLTEQDEANYEWNVKMANTFEYNRTEEREQMVQEVFPKYYEEFELPTVEQLQNNWVEDMVKHHADKFSEFCSMTLSFSGLKKTSSYVKNYIENNKALDKKIDAMVRLTNYVTFYMISKHGINNRLGLDTAIVSEGEQQQNAPYVEQFVVLYGDSVQDYENEKNKPVDNQNAGN